MPFNFAQKMRLSAMPVWMRVAFAALLWLVLISFLHNRLNFERFDGQTVRIGYMPVITNLAAPMLDFASKGGGAIRFEAIKFSSFADMAEALRSRHIQAAFMIAPLSITLAQSGEDVRVVLIGARHESTLVTRKSLMARDISDLDQKTVAVPMRFSGHNLALLELAEKLGDAAKFKIVEMNPPDMAAALATQTLDAYFVGEPFAAQTVRAGQSEVLMLVEEVWPGFMCNLVVVRADFLKKRPEAAKALVTGAARASLWAEANIEQAASILARYWNQSPDLVLYALTTPPNRIVYNQFVPVQEEMQHMADLMQKHGLAASSDIGLLVDDSLARSADLSDITGIESILY
ncbi:MAG: ABC transporter substrate-binding protein [Desulfatibacillaceae bacterium]|nr:ABC transporter substrate-binding protein [Desulfatibacillaceae bacterium]